MVVAICQPATAVGINGTVQTGTSGTPGVAGLGSPQLGNPRELTIAIEVDAATNISVNVSYDGQTWIPASIRNTATKAAIAFAAAGGQVIDITPAPYVQIESSAACHLSAWAYTA